MSLSKKPTDDKKPISSSKLVGLLTPGKKPSIEAKTPTLQNISVTGKRIAPKDIPIAIKSSTQVIKPIKAEEYVQIDKTKELAMDNTVKAMAEAEGNAPPLKGTSLHNRYKEQIDFVNSTGEKLSIQKDAEGNPMYGRQKDFWESASTAISAFRESVASGKTYKDSDDETNRRYLENKRFANTRKPGIPQFENMGGATAGGLFDPIVESVVIGLPTAAATMLGVPGATQAGAALTAGTVGFDMAMSKYGTALEENYFIAREQGMGEKEAYDRAKTVAAKAAGVEGLVQVAFAGMGGLGQAPKGLMGGVVAPAVKGAIQEPKKEALKTFARGFGENMRHALGIGAIVGTGQAVVDNASEQEGIHIEGKEERAIEGGGHMVAMDLAIKAITRAPGTISKSAKSFAKGLLASDEKIASDFISQMEAAGLYEQGTKKVVMKEVKSFSQASKKTPDFMGDGVKKGIAAGLIEKRTKLEAELNKLDPVFREEKQLEIDDINSRLKQLTSTDKPFSVEIELETKPQENATTETTGKVQEGGVSEYQGANQGKQGETTGETTTVETNTGDSAVIGAEEKGKLILSHGGDVKIESFDQSKIKGGARAELGHGFYFSEDGKSKDYGKEMTQIDASSLNIVDERDAVPSDLIQRLRDWQKSLPESPFGLGKKEIADHYIGVMEKELKKNPSMSIGELRRSSLWNVPADRDNLWSEMMVDVGIDGMKATQGDGKGGSSIRQAVIYPQPKLDTLIVKETAPSLSLSDKIRKFKVDQSILTGGDKGAMQSNIAGLPIGIYNASVEAIALTVEAGETIAAAIEKQIESLKKGGRAFDEDKFRKSIMLIDKANSNKGRMAAEAEMQGIKAADYTELQRFALEKYNESEVFRDPAELGKRLRTELDKKMDTSKISDDVFEMIGYDAIVNEKQAPFMPGAQKRATVPVSEFRAEQILTNPREVFKAMYTAATTQAKSTAERLNLSATAISDAIFNEKGERVNPKVIAKAIKMFVTSKMDTETAAVEFAANIKEIKRLSVNNRKFGEIRAKIREIKSASKDKRFSTIATRETTADIDFMAPSKVKDYDVDANGNIIELDTDNRLNEYIELLEEYRKSITGEIPNGHKTRPKFIDFVNDQRDKYDAMQVRKMELRKAEFEGIYDRKIQDGKIKVDENGVPEISKEDFVEARMNPESEVAKKTDFELIDDSEAEVMREMTDVRQEMLKESIDNNEIDADIVEDAKLIAGIDAKKISPKNIQLFNNIIEDVLNGESPSRMGEIVSDIELFNNTESLIGTPATVRDMAKYQKAGISTRVKMAFGYKPGVKAYEELGFSNLFKLLFTNPDAADKARSIVWFPFEQANLKVNNMARDFAQNLSDAFSSKSVVVTDVNGVKTKVKFTAKPLTVSNSYRIGVASTLAQFEDIGRQIQTIVETTKALSEKSYQNSNRLDDYLDNTVMALQSLGIIRGHVKDNRGVYIDLEINPDITMSEISTKLNDREVFSIGLMKKGFKDVAPDLDRTMRQYYGTAIDMSNENYIPLSPKVFGEAPEVLVEGQIDEGIPSHISVMRSSTTMNRQNNLSSVVKKNGKEAILFYNFDVATEVPIRFHETLNTTYTTAPVKTMSKTINSKGFLEFISGKYNQTPTEFVDNKIYFNRQIADVVNMDRKPFVLNKQMQAQNNRLVRFFMGRMLNSISAGVKQYVPSIPALAMHGGIEPFGISYQLLAGKRILDPKTSELLKQFYSKTNSSNRITASIEALQQKSKSINNNKYIRGAINKIDFVEKIAGLSLDLGDQATTMQALMIGYIKGLKISGKITKYSEFNLETELSRGIDPLAMSHAEQFLAFINNESTSSKKAKVFRQDNALVTRLLQSFSHNQNVNALIDFGIVQDHLSGKASADDARKAVGGLVMYLTNIGAYGLTMYGLGYTNYKVAKMSLGLAGVNLHKDEEKQEQNVDRDATRIGLGSMADMITGRIPIQYSTPIKFGLGMTYDLYKKNVAEKEKVMGKDITGTIYDDNYEPILMNDYGGVTGSFLQDVGMMYGTLTSDKDRYIGLIEDQKNAMYTSENIKRFSLLLPFKDFSKAANNYQKVIKDHQITQIDTDGEHYIRTATYQRDKQLALNWYTQEEIDESMNYMRYKSETNKDFKNYVSATVVPHASKMMDDFMMNTSSQIFGVETAKILKNISKKNGNDVVKILNNRYANKDITDEEVKFMIMNGVITPEEYAVSIAYDKNGELRIDASDEQITAQVMKRQVDAEVLRKFVRWGKGEAYPKITPQNIMQAYQNFSSKRYQERERKK